MQRNSQVANLLTVAPSHAPLMVALIQRGTAWSCVIPLKNSRISSDLSSEKKSIELYVIHWLLNQTIPARTPSCRTTARVQALCIVVFTSLKSLISSSNSLPANTGMVCFTMDFEGSGRHSHLWPEHVNCSVHPRWIFFGMNFTAFGPSSTFSRLLVVLHNISLCANFQRTVGCILCG